MKLLGLLNIIIKSAYTETSREHVDCRLIVTEKDMQLKGTHTNGMNHDI
jgi:hypothetical protein